MTPKAAAIDYVSLREGMFALAKERLPDWTDRSPSDMGVLLVELMAWMGDQILYHQERIANESYLPTAVEDRSILNLLRLVGVSPRPPLAASGWLVLHFKSEKGEVSTEIPTGTTFQAEVGGEVVTYRYLGPLIPVRGASVPEVRIPVRQVDAVVSGEAIGSSSGQAGLRIALKRTPILEESLELLVDGELWTRVPSLLLFSGPEDPHYTLERDGVGSWSIGFGDGVHGRIPPRGHANLVASYLVGGGARGNVRARAITKKGVTLAQLDTVTNPSAMTGGADAESLSDAARRAPLQFRAMGRAVTATDLESAALAFGALKATARAGSWNRVDVYALPPGAPPGQEVAADDLFLEALQAHLQELVPITVAVDVRPPRWVPIRLQLRVEFTGRRDPSVARRSVQEALEALYDIDRVSFGAKLNLSKVYEAVEALSGVGSVYVSTFGRGDGRVPRAALGRIELESTELPWLDTSGRSWLNVGEARDD